MRQLDSKKFFFISGPALGHIGRLIAVAKQLNRLNDGYHEILFAVPDISKSTDFIREEGFEFVNIPVGHPNLLSPQSTFTPNLQQTIQDFSPDIIIIDCNMLLWASAIVWPNTPRVLITNIFLTNLAHSKTVQDEMFSSRKTGLNEKRISLGLPPITNYRELYLADLVCLADPIIMVDQLINELPAPYVNYGAITYSYKPHKLAGGKSRERIIVVSMGSSGVKGVPRKTLDTVIQQFSAERVIWIGGNPEPWFKDLNIEYYERAPLEYWIDRAMLVLTQGGAGSSYLSLSRGVPIITIPTHLNHLVLGRILESLSVGISTDDLSNLSDRKLKTINEQVEKWKVSMQSETAIDKLAKNILELLR